MATLVENTADNIQYVNSSAIDNKNAPTLIVQSGDWELTDHVESGIVFDTFGDQPPILTPADARKLAKWLNRAADNLDGVKNCDKKSRHKLRYEQDETDEY